MLDNFLTNEKETYSKTDVVLQKDAENAMDGEYEQRGIPKENVNEKDIYTYNLKQTEIYSSHNEGLENLIPTGHTESKRCRREQLVM